MAIIINFVLVGLWHGANWTYVLFGFVNGCYFIPLIITGSLNKRKKPEDEKLAPSLKEIVSMIGTFLLVTLATILFTSQSIAEAFKYYHRIFSKSLLSVPALPTNKLNTVITIFLVAWGCIPSSINAQGLTDQQMIGLDPIDMSHRGSIQ